MSKPSRPSNPDRKPDRPRTFFTTSSSAGGRALFQTERMAGLLIDVLRAYTKEGRFTVHDFVVMPNHLHMLLTIPGEISVEQAMQLIKGNFSYRAGKDVGFAGEIWQRGFSDVRIVDELSFAEHRAYIDLNPVRAALSGTPEEYPFGSAFMRARKRAGTDAPAQAAVKRHD